MSDTTFVIRNHRGGQVIELALSGVPEPDSWQRLQSRLLRLIEVRQPVELRLDARQVCTLPDFPACLDPIGAALEQFGGRLVVVGEDAPH